MYNRPIMTELCAVQVTVVRHGDVQGSTPQLVAPNSLAHSTGAATQCLGNASAEAVPVLKPRSQSCQGRREHMHMLGEDDCSNGVDAYLRPPLHRYPARCHRPWTQSAAAGEAAPVTAGNQCICCQGRNTKIRHIAVTCLLSASCDFRSKGARQKLKAAAVTTCMYE